MDGSNKYQRYKDKIKLVNETKIAKYLMVRWTFDLDFEKNINIAPNNGNKINDESIGKSINLLSIRLKIKRIQLTLQMHIDI